MSRITSANDAYGHELWACLTEGHAEEIILAQVRERAKRLPPRR